MPQNSPEFDILLCCARSEMNSPWRERLRDLLARSLDWPRVVSAAHAHGLIGLLYLHLKTAFPGRVHPDILGRLREAFLQMAGKNLYQTRALTDILDNFRGKGIPVIPFKGPALGLCAYGDASLRYFADLDILVRRQDVVRAKKLLLGLGFESGFFLPPSREILFLRSHHEYPMERKDGRILLELQWGITPRDFPFQLPMAPLWERAVEMEFEGRKILAFAPEDLFLSLCLHGAEHCWERLIWVCDLAEMVRTHPGMKWEELIGRAEKLGCSRILLLGLFLARRLLGAEIPGAVREKCLADESLKSLSEEAEERLRSKGAASPSLFERSRFYLKATERRRDKFLFGLRMAFGPTVEDWRALSLPSSLSFLYYPIHPFRVFWKYGRLGFKDQKHFSHRDPRGHRAAAPQLKEITLPLPSPKL